MNKLHKILLCLPLCTVGLMSSCTDNLDVEPTSVITSASFFKTEADAKGALIGMYVLLRNDASFNLFGLGEARSETLDNGLAGTQNWDQYYDNILTPSSAGLLSWQSLYGIINASNLLIKYAPKATYASEATKNDILAQAYTMRAFTYFVLAKTWGDVPLRLEPLEGYDASTIQKAKSPVAEVFSLIKADLEQALQLYPNNNFPTGRGFWSKPAANALKADVFLWTAKRLNGGPADFNAVLEACNAVQTADVALLPNYASVFDYSNKGNKEVLMAVKYEPVNAVDNYFFNGWIMASSIPTNLDPADRTAIGQVGGNNIWSPSPEVRRQFTNDDSRKAATFRELYTVSAAGARSYLTSIIVKGDGVVQNGIRYFADDIILYRYADVLLMKAEAKNALNQNPATEINLVRQRAYGTNFAAHTFVNGSKEANDEAILQERLFELAFEGKRWWDLLRFGKAFEKVPSLQAQSGKPHLLLFPIHATVISSEPLVTQNPGYEL